MTEILLCNQSLPSNLIETQCGFKPEMITGLSCVNPDILCSYTPYLACEAPSSIDREIMHLLSAPRVSREVTNFSLSYGEDNTLAIAEIYDRLKTYNVGLMGAGTAVYGQRLKGFGEAVGQYQTALLDYRETIKSGARSAAKNLAKQRVMNAFQKLQQGFRHELNAVTTGMKVGRRGTPLTSAVRAANIAKSSRKIASLNLTSRVQATQLARLGRHAKFLGNGLAVLDFGDRIGNIHNSYKSDGYWERELFIESSSFAASATIGWAAVTFITVATPVGWVALIAGAAAASILVNNYTKDRSGLVYDQIMKAIVK